MLDLNSEDLRIIHRLDDNIKILYEARMRFLYSSTPLDGTGLIDPNLCWITAPPALFKRYRLNENGRWYIEGITPEAKQRIPRVPESVWSAIEGGRIIVMGNDLENSKISSRSIVKGQLEHAYFQGETGAPIEIEGCTMEDCLFWKCTFINVHFLETDFIRSTFLGCEFRDCTVTDSFFDGTIWGEKTNEEGTANRISGLVVNGNVTFKEAKGVGPALFMPEEAIMISNESIVNGNYTWWKGQQLHDAISQRKWV